MRPWKDFWRRKWGLVLAYFVLLLAPIAVEQGEELWGARECERLPLAIKFVHQRLCTAGYFKPRVHFVKLVTLNQNLDPIQDKCEGREFMARLLSRLGSMNPSLVVIDKWYSTDICVNSPGTIDLKSAIATVSLR